MKKGPKGGKHEGVKEEGGHERLSNFTCLIVSQMLPQYPNMRSFEWISTKWEPKRPREALIQPHLFSKFCVFQIWVFETNSAITQVLNTSMWCMSTCFEPHRASLKMSIVPAFGSFWFENYSIYKKRHMFFGTRVVNASTSWDAYLDSFGIWLIRPSHSKNMLALVKIGIL